MTVQQAGRQCACRRLRATPHVCVVPVFGAASGLSRRANPQTAARSGSGNCHGQAAAQATRWVAVARTEGSDPHCQPTAPVPPVPEQQPPAQNKADAKLRDHEKDHQSDPQSQQPLPEGQSKSKASPNTGDSDDNEVIGGLIALVQRAVDARAPVGPMTSFHCVRPPSIAVADYVRRLKRFFCCTDECYVLALTFMERLAIRRPAMSVSALTVHRLFAVSLTLAAKFQDDTYYANKYYAQVAGLSLKELNALEVDMLRTLDYRLFVSPEEFESRRSFMAVHGRVHAATAKTLAAADVAAAMAGA